MFTLLFFCLTWTVSTPYIRGDDDKELALHSGTFPIGFYCCCLLNSHVALDSEALLWHRPRLAALQRCVWQQAISCGDSRILFTGNKSCVANNLKGRKEKEQKRSGALIAFVPHSSSPVTDWPYVAYLPMHYEKGQKLFSTLLSFLRHHQH